MNRTQGFTLVELLVSIALFSILIAIGVGGFTNALHTQREVAAVIAAQSNSSIALEQMTRELRTGYLFCDSPGNNDAMNLHIAPPCLQQVDTDHNVLMGCEQTSNDILTCKNIIDFYNAAGQEVDYDLDANGALSRSESGPDGYIPITGDNVKVDYLTFRIFGNVEGDNWPPRITISIGVSPNSTDPSIANDVLNLQTTVSAREIDCDGSSC